MCTGLWLFCSPRHLPEHSASTIVPVICLTPRRAATWGRPYGDFRTFHSVRRCRIGFMAAAAIVSPMAEIAP